MTDKQIKKFMDHVDAKYDKKKKQYKFAFCGELEIPKDYLKGKKVGRNTLIGIVDMILDAVVKQSSEEIEWIRKNFK